MRRLSAYSSFSEEELILRDLLAIDRTKLANEATFLSYIRTAFALLLAGVTLLNIFHTVFGIVSGVIFILLCLVVLLVGYVRYKKLQASILEIGHVSDELHTQKLEEIKRTNKSLFKLIKDRIYT
jgi:putative membrane protein